MLLFIKIKIYNYNIINFFCAIFFTTIFKFFSFGLTPARPLQVLNPLLPTASCETSLPLATTGLVQRMEPITNLQVRTYLFQLIL